MIIIAVFIIMAGAYTKYTSIKYISMNLLFLFSSFSSDIFSLCQCFCLSETKKQKRNRISDQMKNDSNDKIANGLFWLSVVAHIEVKRAQLKVI